MGKSGQKWTRDKGHPRPTLHPQTSLFQCKLDIFLHSIDLGFDHLFDVTFSRIYFWINYISYSNSSFSTRVTKKSGDHESRVAKYRKSGGQGVERLTGLAHTSSEKIIMKRKIGGEKTKKIKKLGEQINKITGLAHTSPEKFRCGQSEHLSFLAEILRFASTEYIYSSIQPNMCSRRKKCQNIRNLTHFSCISTICRKNQNIYLNPLSCPAVLISCPLLAR